MNTRIIPHRTPTTRDISNVHLKPFWCAFLDSNTIDRHPDSNLDRLASLRTARLIRRPSRYDRSYESPLKKTKLAPPNTPVESDEESSYDGFIYPLEDGNFEIKIKEEKLYIAQIHNEEMDIDLNASPFIHPVKVKKEEDWNKPYTPSYFC